MHKNTVLALASFACVVGSLLVNRYDMGYGFLMATLLVVVLGVGFRIGSRA